MRLIPSGRDTVSRSTPAAAIAGRARLIRVARIAEDHIHLTGVWAAAGWRPRHGGRSSLSFSSHFIPGLVRAARGRCARRTLGPGRGPSTPRQTIRRKNRPAARFGTQLIADPPCSLTSGAIHHSLYQYSKRRLVAYWASGGLPKRIRLQSCSSSRTALAVGVKP